MRGLIVMPAALRGSEELGLLGGLIGGLANLAGSIIGGGRAKKASRKAQAQQLEFLNRALATQEAQRAQDRADFGPFREFGSSAVAPLGDLLGLNGGERQQSGIDAVMASPWYQALYRNGEEAVLQNASATGGLRGGNMQRGLADFGADTLATSIDRMIQQLFGATNTGLGATAQGSAAAQNTANAISQNLGTQGQVTAGGTLTRGGINSQLWNNAGSFLQDMTKWLPF